MPTYVFQCPKCHQRHDIILPISRRHVSPACTCGAKMDRCLKAERIVIHSVETYYDEGLGCDIHGERERRQVMAAQGVIEAGDRVGGARNFDKTGTHAGRLAPQGVRFGDVQRTEERARTEEGNWEIATEGKDGRVENVFKTDELESV